jgi:uncharacterized membrane protein
VASAPPQAVASRGLAPAERRGPLDTVRTNWPVAVLTVVVFAFYGGYAVSRQATMLTSGYDLGIFDQAVRHYARFHAPLVALKGAGYNIFADHFHPIIAVLAPLYWIWDTPYVLLVVQAVLVAASVPIVFDFTQRRLPRGPSLVVAFAYGFGWPVQSLIAFDFHEVAFAVPLLAGAVNALDKGRDRTLVVCAVLLLLIREDMGVLVVILGLLRLTRTPRRVGWILVASGAAGFILAIAVIIPAVSPSGHFSYWTFSALGPDIPSAVHTVVTRPWHVGDVFFTPAIKVKTMAYLFLPVALLSLRSRYMFLAVPLLAERFLNARSQLWTAEFHYNVLPWLVLVLAMVDGADRLGVWHWRPSRWVLLGWLAVVPIALTNWPGALPNLTWQMLDGAAFRLSPTREANRVALQMIPRNVCVWAPDRVAPQLTNRDRVTIPGLGGPGPDFVLLDLDQKSVAYQRGRPQHFLTQMRERGYVTVFRHRAVVLLRSPEYHGPSSRCSPTAP